MFESFRDGFMKTLGVMTAATVSICIIKKFGIKDINITVNKIEND